MKVVGLLSGGKDSCYNLVHCVQQGHELVALATLAPPGSKDELDSYMYQTVGHDAVHLVAEAMGLPLYRRIIKGTAVNQRSEYGSRTASSSTSSSTEDETEDLYHLLADVKAHHPDIQAVSVGAILSNYQRVRVEHVALRPDINLTPLTFLWQRSQSELYAEMLDAGLVSILIKVAGIGLDERDLGKTLGQMQMKLERLSSMYGAHVCGEGGEYETLTIDSPLFRKRIEVGETETVVHSDSGFGSVSYLRLKNARLVDKEDGLTATTARTPPLLDAIGRRTLRAAQAEEDASRTNAADLSNRVSSLDIKDSSLEYPSPSIRRKGRYLVMSNITGLSTSSPSPVSVEDQVANAFGTIRSLLSSALSSQPLGMQHITHINLYLRSQTQFARVNSVYRTLFGVSPPTRACVALTSLPPGCDLVINAIAFDDMPAFDRRALHVQGRSFWAPANIGPYSQSLVQAEKIWVAGQIGLTPADLSLPKEEELQTALSVQHARRILKATMNDMGGRSVEKGWVEGGICWLDDVGRVEIARRAWMCQGESDDDDDDGEEEKEGEETENWLGQTGGDGSKVRPMLFVVLPKASLPRSAAIEWQLTAHTGRIPPPIELTEDTVPSDESEDDDDDNEPGSDTTDVRITRQTATVESFEVVHTITSSSLNIVLFSSAEMT
uniref:Diphthine--ammonia ligase n=1 Tax=Kalmanozyma brasiliensis (strain GHG001) TaxID=1365824 RepID=V5EZ25_KALBG